MVIHQSWTRLFMLLISFGLINYLEKVNNKEARLDPLKDIVYDIPDLTTTYYTDKGEQRRNILIVIFHYSCFYLKKVGGAYIQIYYYYNQFC